MIHCLYPPFKKWSEKGTLWVYSDPHFSDPDMLGLRKNYLSDEEQVRRINSKVGKYDTIIFLGDIGNKEVVRKIRGYKVLIMGNHDSGATNYTDIFNEVYEGPLFIAEKLVLSHEPVNVPFAVNVHGHEHRYVFRDRHFNVCAEHINYTPVNLDREIKQGLLSKVESIHRRTIDKATERKKGVINGKYSLDDNRCGCSKCHQHQMNFDETDWHCISFGYTVRIIQNILECEESLQPEYRDAMKMTCEKIEELDRALRKKEET